MVKRLAKSGNKRNTVRIGERMKVTVAKFKQHVYFHFRLDNKNDKLSLNRDDIRALYDPEIKSKLVKLSRKVRHQPEKKSHSDSGDSSNGESSDVESSDDGF